ncbi:MAG: hypothetical protein AAF487_08765 [Bacteroidota bacterium]
MRRDINENENEEREILNEFEVGSTFSNLEKEEEYYRMFKHRYGYDPRDSEEAA